MKKILISILNLFLISISFEGFSQTTIFYTLIEDENLKPTQILSKTTGQLEYYSNDQQMANLLALYKPEVFKQAFPTAQTPWLRNVFYVRVSDKQFGEELKATFNDKIGNIEYLCEPEVLYTPNDYSPYGSQTNLDIIHVENAYDIYKDLPKLTICLTDTYFDTLHEDLDFIGIQGNNDPNNAFNPNHGTAVSGCIAAVTDNGTGIASIGFNTQLYGSTTWGIDNEVLLLAQAGYKVINCSWFNSCSYSSYQRAVYQEIKNIYGTIVLFGAGNHANHCYSLDAYLYPASYPEVISVTAVGHQASNADIHEEIPGDPTSAYHHNDAVDICAAGYNVYTTDRMGLEGSSPNNYVGAWGTSFATPQVTATIGVIWNINPCLSADEVINILLNSADNNIYNISYNQPYLGKLGSGRLDVHAAAYAAAQSATLNVEDITITTSQNFESNYSISISDVTIQSGNIFFKTRKSIVINGPFELQQGAMCSFDVNTNNIISCY